MQKREELRALKRKIKMSRLKRGKSKEKNMCMEKKERKMKVKKNMCMRE
jgi:hypothetical protein